LKSYRNSANLILLDGDGLGDGHHLVARHSVPLLILHLDRKGHQVGSFQPTALRECVGAGALEIKPSSIKGLIMRVAGGMAHTLTNGVTFLDAIFYFTFFIGATCELLALNLKKKSQEHILYPTDWLDTPQWCLLCTACSCRRLQSHQLRPRCAPYWEISCCCTSQH
uniref:Uncharacterized protein n=1 Tax=Amphiprion percula TaxID=161767 RepID=A0A3P8T8I3_AMPPE